MACGILVLWLGIEPQTLSSETTDSYSEQPENSQGAIDIHLIHACSYQNTAISFFETSIKYALFSLIPS